MGMYDENNEGRYQEDAPQNGRQNKPGKKKGWLWALAGFGAALLIVSAIAGAAFAANSIYKAARGEDTTYEIETQTNADATAPVRETPSESKADNTPSEAADASKAAEASKADTGKTILTVSDEIKTTDNKGSVTVLDVSDIVDAVMPTVVAITDTLEYKAIQSYDPYSYFFGQGGGRSSYEGVASGSGVIVGASETELLVVTNNHVVDATSETSSGYSVSSKGLTITFSDGSTAPATVKGTDPDNDLAVIAAKLSDLSDKTKGAIRIAVLGSSDDLKVGDGVIAIGNAGGYGQSVTTGIISAKNRKVTINDVTFSLLQTDAAINPGNSGGGLFNADGELIGINNSKTVSTDIEGMGFAIPISSAKFIIENLMNLKEVPEEDKGYLGITMSTVPQQYVSQGYPAGVLVSEVVKGSPAEKAGLKAQDIITAVSGRTVKSGEALRAVLDSCEAGTTVTLTVQRPSGKTYQEIEVKVTLGRYQDIDFESVEESTTEAPTEDEYDLDDILKEFFGH